MVLLELVLGVCSIFGHRIRKHHKYSKMTYADSNEDYVDFEPTTDPLPFLCNNNIIALPSSSKISICGIP